jgi:hypothetical protein
VKVRQLKTRRRSYEDNINSDLNIAVKHKNFVIFNNSEAHPGGGGGWLPGCSPSKPPKT